MTSEQDDVEANKRLILEFWRTVWEPQRIENAAKFVAEDMIEHNPMAGPGLAGFRQAFESTWTPRPIADRLSTEFIFVAEGDMVVTIKKLWRTDPDDRSQKYANWWYDAFRIRDGKIAEHWDGRLREDTATWEGARRSTSDASG